MYPLYHFNFFPLKITCYHKMTPTFSFAFVWHVFVHPFGFILSISLLQCFHIYVHIHIHIQNLYTGLFKIYITIMANLCLSEGVTHWRSLSMKLCRWNRNTLLKAFLFSRNSSFEKTFYANLPNHWLSKPTGVVNKIK